MRDFLELGLLVGALVGVLAGLSAAMDTIREDKHTRSGEAVFLTIAGMFIGTVYWAANGGLLALALWIFTLPFQALGAWLMP